MIVDEIKNALSYDAATGVFSWINCSKKNLNGTAAGAVQSGGYIQITYAGTSYMAHRLAWFYSTGRFPSCQIDHINGNRSDNRIENLRLATQPQNMINSQRRPNSTTGERGIQRLPSGAFRLKVSGIHKGCFASLEEAVHARNEIVKESFGGEFMPRSERPKYQSTR